MTAKQYLCQLKKIDVLIDQKIAEKEFMKGKLYGGSIAPKEVQVLSSVPADPMADTVAKIVDLEAQIDRETDRLVDMRTKIVSQIQQLDQPLHAQILYKRYVEYKPWEKIEVEMHYSYQHLQRAHVKALKAFAYKHEIK